jgi:PIN domain nuclease of toxin-antitoxin system
VRLLLDTHVLLWALQASRRLSRAARAAIVDPGNEVWVSAVSPWEIEIKRAVGRVRAPDDVLTEIRRARFLPLPITLEHGVAAGTLPLHHRDPFDRLLIGQAQGEGLTVVTHDSDFARYQVAILSV